MVAMRLARIGSKKRPYYRIVVSDSLKTPLAATVEQIGFYNPGKSPAQFEIDKARVEYWTGKGAKLSPTVKSLLKKKQ